MKIATIADIHGNLFALESVLKDCQRKGIDQSSFWAITSQMGHFLTKCWINSQAEWCSDQREPRRLDPSICSQN